MKLKEQKKIVKKVIRYSANALLVLSILFTIVGLYGQGTAVFSRADFWMIIIAIWQVVIMLMLVENFYLKK